MQSQSSINHAAIWRSHALRLLVRPMLLLSLLGTGGISPALHAKANTYQSSRPSPAEVPLDIPMDGRSVRTEIEVVNTTTETWYEGDPIAFNYQHEDGDSGSNGNTASRFYCDDWETENPHGRVEYLRNGPVAPGETARLRVWFCNPADILPRIQPTMVDDYPHTEHYALAKSGEWLTNPDGTRIKVTVRLRVTHQARSPVPTSLVVNLPYQGISEPVTIMVENDGSTLWDAAMLIALNYQYQQGDNSGSNGFLDSKFYCDGEWDSHHRPIYMAESAVAEGQQATFTFRFCDQDDEIPSVIGNSYTERFVIAAGPIWMLSSTGNRRVLTVTFNIVEPTTSACAGDVDTDDDRDIVDMQMMSARWNTPGNETPYDLNNDGIVDIADIQQEGLLWNTLCNEIEGI